MEDVDAEVGIGGASGTNDVGVGGIGGVCGIGVIEGGYICFIGVGVVSIIRGVVGGLGDIMCLKRRM